METAGNADRLAREDDGLPYLDEHAISIGAARQVVWAALRQYVHTSLFLSEDSLFARFLGSEPRAGFEVSQSTPPERLDLVGRHRFSRYRLAFALEETAGGETRLRATSYAVFPGLHGRLYRAAVIGTRFHVIATNRILRSVRRLSIASTAPGPPQA